MFEVRLVPDADAFYARADRELAAKLARCFHLLEQEPRRHPNIKALKGSRAGRFRFRVGDYRVIYRIDDTAKVVHVIDIAHRRDVYE
jgi:mRNA interferase RelE/StbE